MQRRQVMQLLAYALLQGGGQVVQASPQSHQPYSPDYVAWVQQVLDRMHTIKPGMTRRELLKVFKLDGGMSTLDQATFVSRECLFFKVDVTFKLAVSNTTKRGKAVPSVENSRDVILAMSQFYLGYQNLN